MEIGKAADLESVTKLFTMHMKLTREHFTITDTTRIYAETPAGARHNLVTPRLLRVRFQEEEMVNSVAKAAAYLDSAGDPAIRKVQVFRD